MIKRKINKTHSNNRATTRVAPTNKTASSSVIPLTPSVTESKGNEARNLFKFIFSLFSLKTKDYKLKTNFGFTLVELIVVIVILGILATIAFLSFSNQSGSARDGVRMVDLSNTKKALELFIIKAGTYPVPDESTVLSGGVNNTGSVIYQGVLSDSVARKIGLSKVIVDPLTQDKYTYSTFSNGLYYQIASSLENDSGVVGFNDGVDSSNIGNIIEKVNAVDNTSSPFVTTKVEGNYRIDPSLPSLILTKDSQDLIKSNTLSGIFDPSVCFVINGGTNTLTSSSGSCQKKSEMNLKDFDDSLVGYWDMETTFNNGGIDYLKDLSGNGNYGSFSGGMNNISSLTGGIIGKGRTFSGNWIEIINNYGLDIENDITISSVIKTNYCINTCTIFSRNSNYNLHMANLYYRFGDSNGDGFQINLNNDSGYHIYVGKWDKKTNVIYLFLDGRVIGKGIPDNAGIIKKNSNISNINYIGNNQKVPTELFDGTIDDIKIYNRALSDEEIRQQAKIAGF